MCFVVIYFYMLKRSFQPYAICTQRNATQRTQEVANDIASICHVICLASN